ncbi:MAG: Ig-like domain-containing protein [Planctomycetota bacterium]
MIRADRLSLLLVLSFTLLFAVSCGGGGSGGGGSGKKQEVRGFRVTEVDPPDGSLGVPVDSAIRMTLSATIRSTSVSEDNVLLSLRGTGKPVRGTVELSSGNSIITFTPDAPFLLNTKYRVRVLSDVLSSTGVPLGETFVSHFTSAITSGPPPPPPPSSTWGQITLVGKMNLGRSSHTSTLLSDGRVLVTGGFVSADAVSNTAEIYDGSNFTFTYVPENMEFSRGFHTATRLSDGKVLILGGVSGANFAETNSAEIYDPATGQFTTLVPGMLFPRAFHTATLLDDGRVLILGGTVPTTNGVFSSKEAEIFDPVTKTFLFLPNMAAYRAGHTATMLDDDRVLILGGNSSDLTIEIFDADENKFVTSEEELYRARRGHTATKIFTGDVVVFGGGDRSAGIWVAKDSQYKWTVGVPIEDRKDHTATVTESGRILIAGGSRYEASRTLFSQTTEYYERFSGAFLSAAPLLVDPTTRHRATTLRSGNILLTGGSNVDGSSAELKNAMIYHESD